MPDNKATLGRRCVSTIDACPMLMKVFSSHLPGGDGRMQLLHQGALRLDFGLGHILNSLSGREKQLLAMQQKADS